MDLVREINMSRVTMSALGCVLLGLAGCTSAGDQTNVRRGAAAYDAIPAPSGQAAITEYVIGPLDTIDVNVFQEPDITTKGVSVDASGNLALPLIGSVHAAGLTAAQLSTLLAQRLSKDFYVNPQVSVVVENSVSQQVTVEGEVAQPGIFPLKGPATLLDAVALAKGETPVASTRHVYIIRQINGQRMAALFDMNEIRSGADADPAVIGGDVVVVGHSNGKQAFENVLRASPLISGIFYHF